MGDLHDVVGECDWVYMTIQPSDDLYHKKTIETIQNAFEKYQDLQAIGFAQGYIINYWTKEIAEYNPTTNPPFYTLKFKSEIFLDPLKHSQYTALKMDVGQYKKGTPLPSHEYVENCLKYNQIADRGFMVGTHQENISTTWQIPFKGRRIDNFRREGQTRAEVGDVLDSFGILSTNTLHASGIKIPTRKRIYFALPYKAQRKIRYWLTEKFVFTFKNPLKRLWFWRNYTTKQHMNWWKNRKIDWQKEYISTWNHPHRQLLAGILSQMPWMSLFEIGCGGGPNLIQIAKSLHGRQFQLGGTDINADAIEAAKNNGVFKGGAFFVCPADDTLMSDKSSDVVLTDMMLIYISPKDIMRHLLEFKRIARGWVIFCELDSTHAKERWWVKLSTGYNVYDYKQLLQKAGYYDIMKYKLKEEHWPNDPLHLKYASIIIAKVPEYA